MKNVVLNRIVSNRICTLGELEHIDKNGTRHKWVTLEKPWLDNKPFHSCIEGNGLMYLCRKAYYNKGGYVCYEVTEVNNRNYILFHIGNYAKDVSGCIAVGTKINKDKNMITQSKKGFNDFMDKMDCCEYFILRIEDRF